MVSCGLHMRQINNMPSSVISSHIMHLGVLTTASHAIFTGTLFSVFCRPRKGSTIFIFLLCPLLHSDGYFWQPSNNDIKLWRSSSQARASLTRTGRCLHSRRATAPSSMTRSGSGSSRRLRLRMIRRQSSMTMHKKITRPQVGIGGQQWRGRRLRRVARRPYLQREVVFFSVVFSSYYDRCPFFAL